MSALKLKNMHPFNISVCIYIKAHTHTHTCLALNLNYTNLTVESVAIVTVVAKAVRLLMPLGFFVVVVISCILFLSVMLTSICGTVNRKTPAPPLNSTTQL